MTHHYYWGLFSFVLCIHTFFFYFYEFLINTFLFPFRSRNNIGAEGAIAIAEALGTNTSLQELWLEYVNFFMFLKIFYCGDDDDL